MNTPQLDIFVTLKAYVQTRQPVWRDVRPVCTPRQLSLSDQAL